MQGRLGATRDSGPAGCRVSGHAGRPGESRSRDTARDRPAARRAFGPPQARQPIRPAPAAAERPPRGRGLRAAGPETPRQTNRGWNAERSAIRSSERRPSPRGTLRCGICFAGGLIQNMSSAASEFRQDVARRLSGCKPYLIGYPRKSLLYRPSLKILYCVITQTLRLQVRKITKFGNFDQYIFQHTEFQRWSILKGASRPCGCATEADRRGGRRGGLNRSGRRPSAIDDRAGQPGRRGP